MSFGNLEGKPLTIKELAAAFRRNRTYIQAMKRNGFVMIDGKATVAEAKAWLARNPPPRSQRTFKAAA